MSVIRPFHAAYPVKSLEEVIDFYCRILGCGKGRSDDTWIDLDFFGHQLVFHQVDTDSINNFHNPVDSDQVPVPHFGVILEWSQWESLGTQLKLAGCEFVIEPRVRFAGKVGEQGTFFIKDPNDYYLEFKAFKDDSGIFAS